MRHSLNLLHFLHVRLLIWRCVFIGFPFHVTALWSCQFYVNWIWTNGHFIEGTSLLFSWELISIVTVLKVFRCTLQDEEVEWLIPAISRNLLFSYYEVPWVQFSRLSLKSIFRSDRQKRKYFFYITCIFSGNTAFIH